MSRKLILTLIFSLCVIALVFYLTFRTFSNIGAVHPVGSTLSEQDMLQDLQTLGSNEVDADHFGTFFNGTNKDLTVPNPDGSVNKSSRILNLRVRNKWFSNPPIQPLEVREALRVWDYLDQRTPPYPIAGVRVMYDQRWVISPTEAVLISHQDFEQVKKDAPQTNETEDQKITIWSDLWIEQHHYVQKQSHN